MRGFSALIMGVALMACGQPGDANGAPTPQGGASAGGQTAYVEACIARYVAQSEQARQWAPDQCVRDWELVVATLPMADAILAAAGGTMPAAGRMGSALEVTVDARARTVAFAWGATGEMIPYDVVGALVERGAPTTMIGCSQVGVGEFSKAYRVAPQSGTPFQLSIYARSAPTANAESFYTVTADLSGRIETRAQLASDGSEWTDACAY